MSELNEKLSRVKADIAELVQRYLALEDQLLKDKVDVKKFDIDIDVMENKINLCKFHIEVLECDRRRKAMRMENVPREGQPVVECETVQKMGQEKGQEKGEHQQGDQVYWQSDQERMQHQKMLLEELRRQVNQMEGLMTNKIRGK